MLRGFMQASACVMVLAVLPLGAAQAGALIVGASRGDASFSSSDWQDGSAGKFHAGYQLQAVPVFFDVTLMDSGDGKITNTNASAKVEATQVGVGAGVFSKSGSGIFKSGSGVFARVGFYDADSKLMGPFPDQTYGSSGTYYGVGAAWMFLPMLGVRIDWESLPGVEHLVEQDVTLTTLGVVGRFSFTPE